MVEAWSQCEALNTPWEMLLSAVGTDARFDVRRLPGQPVTLITHLSDGSDLRRSDIVIRARRGDSDGGLTRYGLTVRPWLHLLTHTVRSYTGSTKTGSSMGAATLRKSAGSSV